jgi:Protein of unknown function (DUF3303)
LKLVDFVHYLVVVVSVYLGHVEPDLLVHDGLRYVDSWIVADDSLDRGFQLIETDDPAWFASWSDLGTFEVVPVIKSDEAARRVNVSRSGTTR